MPTATVEMMKEDDNIKEMEKHTFTHTNIRIFTQYFTEGLLQSRSRMRSELKPASMRKKWL